MKISDNLRRFGELMGRTLELEKEFWAEGYKDSYQLVEIKTKVFELSMDILEWKCPAHYLPMHNLLLDMGSKIITAEINEETLRRIVT